MIHRDTKWYPRKKFKYTVKKHRKAMEGEEFKWLTVTHCETGKPTTYENCKTKRCGRKKLHSRAYKYHSLSIGQRRYKENTL